MKPAIRSLARAIAPVWQALPAGVRQLAVSLREQLYLVSVAAVIRDDCGRVLLLEHRFRRPTVGLPGGFVRRDEQPADAVRREVREEVGLEIDDVELVLAARLVDTAQVELVYSGRSGGEPTPDRHEITDARWFALAELPAALHADERQRILHVLGRRATPSS
jgi:8-oxo-dGTP diphosphatase